ncbi:MAG: RAD55 family ATPase [Archaeoglobaceae archaeon]
MERIPTGIFGFDELLFGGFVKNTVNAVFGTVGCGKTIFSIQFLLEGLESGQHGVYASFDLEKDELVRIAKSLGWDLEKYIENGLLRVGKFYVEDSFVGSDLVKFVSGRDIRIVVDSFTPLVANVESSRVRNEVNWFFKNLRECGTAVVTIEEPLVGVADGNVNIPLFLADSVIYLKNVGYGEVYSRTLRILKHRMSPHFDGVFPFSIIEGAGIVVEEKRTEGFDAEVDDLPIPERCKEKLKKLCREGMLKREELEKIRKRLV